MKLKKVLVLGGTRFFGKHLVEALLQEEHDVTIATRGVTEDSFGSAVKRIIIDREDGKLLEKCLEGKSYDIVYDKTIPHVLSQFYHTKRRCSFLHKR